MSMRLFLVFSLIFSLSIPVAWAEDSSEPAAAESPEVGVANSKKELLLEKIAQVTRTLDKKEANHFFVMYANYAIVSMVKAVQDDVSEAVTACAKNNKDMEKKVNDRFERWKSTVKGPMDEADANIANMSLAQTYMPQAEVKQIFTLVDETRAIGSSRFETIPVSTPEACEFMLSKMDETEKSMTSLLAATMRSFSNVIEKTQE